MKTKNYEKMTKTEIVNLLNLKRRYYDCFGEEYRNGVEVYHSETETEKARYVYTLDNIMSNDLDNGKNYSFVLKVRASDNLLSVLKGFPHLTTVNACKTKTEAERLTFFWNECYKNNGTYLFN